MWGVGTGQPRRVEGSSRRFRSKEIPSTEGRDSTLGPQGRKREDLFM